MPSKSVEELARIGAEAILEDQEPDLSPRDRAVYVAHIEAVLLEKFDAHMNAKLGIKPSGKPKDSHTG